MKENIFEPVKRTIEDYRSIVQNDVLNEIYHYAGILQGEHIVMVNSTPAGGGVAEILNSLVLLLNSLGIKTGWRILKGSDSFFSITKSFHNALQGGDINIHKRMKSLYQQTNFNNALMNHLDVHDLVVVHDPQPLPLIYFYKKRIPWIWRFHPDLSEPNQSLMKFLKPFIERYDAMIVSSESYKKSIFDIKQIVIHPSIDPLTEKNQDMSMNQATVLLKRKGISTRKPIMSQISRFDKWKDPLGVVRVYRQVKKKIDCQLVLLGNMASDDPEGPEIYRAVMKEVNNDKDITVLMNVSDNDRTVNALQRASTVVLQKSLKEGFALTVSEALWKGTPVIGSRVGGIPLQVIHNKTGLLVNNIKETTSAVLNIMNSKNLRNRLGKQGKEHVRKNFLITRHVLDYLKLFHFYLARQHKFNIGKKYPY